MRIGEYTKHYTSGEPIRFRSVLSEVKEFLQDLVRWNVEGMKEEFEDVLHFVQLWLYSRFGIDGEIWYATRHSVKKFMDRKEVWRRIYAFVGLPEDISCYVGNYNKVAKVVTHLGKFGVSKERAEEAHRRIVLRA